MDIIQLILTVAAIVLYGVQWRRLVGGAFATAGAGVHALSLVAHFAAEPRLQLATLLSAFMVATLLVAWRSLHFAALRRGLLAAAMVAVAAPLLLPQTPAAAFSLHSVLALTVYALAAVAFLLCLDLRLGERQMRQAPPDGGAGGALLQREKVYFNYVLLSFVVLTLTLISGVAGAMSSGAPVFSLTHKQLFAYLTWLVFALLLAGRHLAGWRGNVAQRWFFAGYAFLLLSYIGSAAVAQILLGRGAGG